MSTMRGRAEPIRSLIDCIRAIGSTLPVALHYSGESQVVSESMHDFVGIVSGTLIYVSVADRAKFEAIQRPSVDHGCRKDGSRVFTKQIEMDGVAVIFHYWISDAIRPCSSTGG